MYQEIESSARDFYKEFRRLNFSQLTKHYIKLKRKLWPLFAACSGGCADLYPLSLIVKKDGFEFASKLRVLVKELIQIRSSDPTSKYASNMAFAARLPSQ